MESKQKLTCTKDVDCALYCGWPDTISINKRSIGFYPLAKEHWHYGETDDELCLRYKRHYPMNGNSVKPICYNGTCGAQTDTGFVYITLDYNFVYLTEI